MTVAKVSLSLDEKALEEARSRVGKRELSSYVSTALRRQLQHDRLRDLLDSMDAEAGPVPAELLDAARELWRN
jgi:Arc/MetJ family transcription regulator